MCGCGTSLSELKNPERFTTIGVNDVGAFFNPTYLVCVNDHHGFNKEPDRWKHIENTQANAVFTHIKDLAICNKDKIVELSLGKYGSTDWETDKISYTSNSPYIAVCIAAFFSAKKIYIIGVDFTRDHFFGKTGEHSLNNKINSINVEYQNLHRALALKGIEFYNLSQTSRIDIPKIKIEDL